VTTLTTGLRDGPEYGSQTLYVPTGAEPPFAAVAIAPGYEEPESTIQAWGPFLASHGIVALTIGTNIPTDGAEERASALLDALETIKAEDRRPGSPLAAKLARDRLGVMGWSMGGAGTLIAAESTPSLKAAITMAAWSPGEEFSDDQVPTLLFAGSADEVSGGQAQDFFTNEVSGGQAQDFFTSLPSTTPKMLYEVRGGEHEIGNDPQNASGEIGRYGLSWLEVFLVGDQRYRQFLEEMPTQASDFRKNLLSTP
jgi:dienelactone hydrolase